MQENTIVIVGAGYAGIHAAQSIINTFSDKRDKTRVRIILIDKEPYHLRKVLLFKSAVNEENITIPLQEIFPRDVNIIEGEVTRVVQDENRIGYRDRSGKEHNLNYDYLILATGSNVRKPKADQGGIALTDLNATNRIRQIWKENFRRALSEKSLDEQERLLTITVAGAGISGIETAAELADAAKKEAALLGLKQKTIKVYLLNSHERLFMQGPVKVGRKLEQILHESGVMVIHGVKALEEKGGRLSLSNGTTISTGLCIWTIGMEPNPIAQDIGLPLAPSGQLIVGSSYQVQGAKNIYSIGDCAQIIDPATGRRDEMTCKEAMAQAARMGKILMAHIEGRRAPVHKSCIDTFCFSLGPGKGLVWIRKWGLDLFITGKLGWNIRRLTWDLGSMIK